jgi:hypothetical protein
MSHIAFQKARQTAEWLLSAQQMINSYKELRKPEIELIKEFKTAVKEIKENLREFCEVAPAFIHQTELGCVKAGVKSLKVASKIDITKGIAVINQALEEIQNQTVDAALLQQMQKSIAEELQLDASSANADASTTVVKITKKKASKKKGAVAASATKNTLTHGNFVQKINQLLHKVPPTIPLPELKEESEEEEEESENNEPEEEEEQKIVVEQTPPKARGRKRNINEVAIEEKEEKKSPKIENIGSLKEEENNEEIHHNEQD